MIQTAINFLKDEPYLIYGPLGLLTLFILLRRASSEHIRCKVIEKGRYRYTDVYRSRRTNIYKVHNRDGKWVTLNAEQVKIIEEVRAKFAKRIKYNKHVTPEFKLSE